MKKLNKETKKILNFNWNVRLKLYAEGDKLYAEGDKLYAKGKKLWAEGNKLYAEGDKLYAEGYNLHAEGNKLYAEGSKLWAETILEFCGNIKLEWKNWKDNKGYECHLETGDVFKP